MATKKFVAIVKINSNVKNFQFIDEIIDFVGTINDRNSELHIISIDKLESEFSRFKVTHKIEDFVACIYTIPLERFMLFQSDENIVKAIHLYVKPTNNLVDLIEADLGGYKMAASWGTEENSDLKIFSWNYGRFVVDLRKSVQNLDANYMLLPPYDVITISNDVQKKLK